MITVGVICEYNPFHKGHGRLLRSIRSHFDGEEVCILSLMSGSFVQRGDLALFPKYDRAAVALAHGSDLVLELPYPFSGACGEVFASAGVFLLSALAVDYIAFGSQRQDGNALREISRRLTDPSFENALEEKKKREPHRAFALLRDELYRTVYGEELLLQPNDSLGLEYLKAVRRQNSPLIPLILPRRGEETASASRQAIQDRRWDEAKRLLSQEAMEHFRGLRPVTVASVEKAVIAALRLGGEERFASVADVPPGLVSRLRKAAMKATTWDALVAEAATKKYTNARIRRGLLSCLLGVTRERLAKAPSFTRLLGTNERGRLFLRQTGFPVITRGGQDRQWGGEVTDGVAFADRADAFYALANENPPVLAPILL